MGPPRPSRWLTVLVCVFTACGHGELVPVRVPEDQGADGWVPNLDDFLWRGNHQQEAPVLDAEMGRGRRGGSQALGTCDNSVHSVPKYTQDRTVSIPVHKGQVHPIPNCTITRSFRTAFHRELDTCILMRMSFVTCVFLPFSDSAK